jgi:ribosome-associated protein
MPKRPPKSRQPVSNEQPAVRPFDDFDEDELSNDTNSELDPAENAEDQNASTKLGPEFIDEFGRPNKSALKRRATDLQAMGEALIALPQVEFDEMPMPEILRDAVALARRITQFGGLYRQKQYIGKLMRKIDAEPIRVALLARQESQRAAARQFQRIERWRNRLIDEPSCIDEFTALYSQSDRARIVRLIEQARHERLRQNASGASRELFGYIRDLFAEIDPTQSAPEPK